MGPIEGVGHNGMARTTIPEITQSYSCRFLSRNYKKSVIAVERNELKIEVVDVVVTFKEGGG